MFYSHEVLTSRKYGVATVWLVATLGSKSNLKKVNRKAIQGVDVQKACETIVTPDAPMALRLQSNLLYGVARVYSQQCGYVLSDAEQANREMRMLVRAMQANTLNIEADNRGRAEQLMLQDDPNFLPDFELMPLDFGDLGLGNAVLDGSQAATLSPYNSQLTGAGIGTPQEIGGLQIPPSASSFVGGPVRGSAGLGDLSARSGSAAARRVDIGGLDDDLGLAIDEDGNLLIADEQVRQPTVASVRGERTEVGSVALRGRADREDVQQDDNILAPPDDDGYMPIQDDYTFDFDAEAAASEAGQQLPQEQQVTSEETAVAQARPRRQAARRSIPMDNTMELRNSELARWQADYVANMHEAICVKTAHQATALAKKNAEYWMLGEDNDAPLSIFSGAKLLKALTGVDLRTGQKHPRDEGYETDEARRVRPRLEPSSDEVGRGFQDDNGYMPMMDDDTIEQGREAPTPLDDRQVSSMMPWNQSGGSRRPTGAFSAAGVPTSASFGGPLPQLSSLPRRPSRLTSASPLMGRGTTGAGMDDLQLPGSQADFDTIGLDEFELFGPAAQVDTQTAAQSQWQRAVLDGESAHFLEFVQAGVEELDQSREEASVIDEEDDQAKGSIDFDTLLPPADHSHIVAAQALLHVLALGTKNLLTVEQPEPFGAITIRVRGAAASQ